MDYQMIAEELVKKGFLKNSYGSLEKTIGNINIKFVEHPFYHVIMYYKQNKDRSILYEPEEIKLPKKCDLNNVIFVIDSLVQGVDENKIIMGIIERLNIDKASNKDKITNKKEVKNVYRSHSIDKRNLTFEDKHLNVKDKIISAVAEKACKRISSKVVRILQSLTEGLSSGDDSPLKNIWDEVCVQVQDEEFIFWDDYLNMIESMIKCEVDRIDDEIKQAIWLQTNEGIDWAEDYEEGNTLAYYEEDITKYILHDFVLQMASNWTNKRIEKYLNREFD